MAAYQKSIVWDRESKDFAMFLDGELVGYARSYLEAETILNDRVHSLLSDGILPVEQVIRCNDCGNPIDGRCYRCDEANEHRWQHEAEAQAEREAEEREAAHCNTCGSILEPDEQCGCSHAPKVDQYSYSQDEVQGLLKQVKARGLSVLANCRPVLRGAVEGALAYERMKREAAAESVNRFNFLVAEGFNDVEKYGRKYALETMADDVRAVVEAELARLDAIWAAERAQGNPGPDDEIIWYPTTAEELRAERRELVQSCADAIEQMGRSEVAPLIADLLDDAGAEIERRAAEMADGALRRAA